MKLKLVMKLQLVLIAGAGLPLAVASLAHAQSHPWEESLRQQLKADQNCELSYLTGIREFELQGRTSISARAHCADKRAFDINRDGGAQKFKMQGCLFESC